jgi:hypothetical protein
MAAVLGSATLLVVEVLLRLPPTHGLNVGGLHPQLALVVFLVSAAIGTTVTLVRLPTITSVARWADQRLALRDRLVTSVGGGCPDRELTLVARAQLEDAARHAARIRSQTLLPIGLPRWVIVVPLFVVASLALALVPAPLLEPPPVEAEAFDAQSASTTVRRVTDLLQAVSAGDDNAYLRAVSEAFSELADQLDAGAVNALAYTHQVDQLLEHLAEALGDRDDALATRIAELVGDRNDDQVLPSTMPADLMGGYSDGTLAEYGLSPELRATTDQLTSLLERLIGEFTGTVPDGGDDGGRPGREVGLNEAERGGGDYTEDLGFQPPAGLLVDADAGGAPAGAADESDAAPGDAAGGGLQPIGIADPGEAIDGLAFDDAPVSLPWSEADNGEQVERDVVPDAVDVHASVPPSADDRPHHRSDEGAATREAVSPSFRRTVIRYFLPAEVGRTQHGP